jgi:hypothetical protein
MSPLFLFHFVSFFHCRRRRKESWQLHPAVFPSAGAPEFRASIWTAGHTPAVLRAQNAHDSQALYGPFFSALKSQISNFKSIRVFRVFRGNSFAPIRLLQLILRCWKPARNLSESMLDVAVRCSSTCNLQPATFNAPHAPTLRRFTLSTLNFFNEVPL